MKKYVITIIVFLFCGCITIPKLNGQAPGAMTYQAEVRDTKGKILNNKYLDVTIGILEGSIGTTPVLTYTYSVTTDKYGLFTVTIGNPTDPYDPLYGLDWETEPHYLEVQVTDDKYNTYDLGTSQFLSVPYALHARTAETAIIDNVNDADSDPSNELQDWGTLPGIPEEIADGDDVDDADASSLNELQNLTLEGDILKLSRTNDEVSLNKYVSQWRLWGDDLLQFTGAVDIGDNYTSGPALRVDGNITVGKRGENPGTYGISGPSTESGISLTGGTLGGGQIYLFGPEHISHPDEVHLRTGGNRRIIIKSDGNVGIGTSAPNYNLDVSGDINFTGTLLQNGNPFNINDADADPTNELQTISISGNEIQLSKLGGTVILPENTADNLGNHVLESNLNTSGNWISGNGNASGIFVSSNEQVGIGSDSPSEAFEVNGNIKTSNDVMVGDNVYADDFKYNTTVSKTLYIPSHAGEYNRPFSNITGHYPFYSNLSSSNEVRILYYSINLPLGANFRSFSLNLASNVGIGWYLYRIDESGNPTEINSGGDSTPGWHWAGPFNVDYTVDSSSWLTFYIFASGGGENQIRAIKIEYDIEKL